MEHDCPHHGHADDPYHHACKDCREQSCGEHHLSLHVARSLVEDGDRFMARMAPCNLEFLRVKQGDFVMLEGASKALVPVGPVLPVRGAEAVVHLDPLSLKNAQTGIFQKVTLWPVQAETAQSVTLRPVKSLLLKPDRRAALVSQLDGFVVLEGNSIPLETSGTRREAFEVVSATPAGPVRIEKNTQVTFDTEEQTETETGVLGYGDIGGLDREIERIKEVVELPLRFPQLFERLGVDAPKGILLHGPPGSGKTLIARAVAQETHADFQHINGPEIMQRHYGESEEKLRGYFDKAQENAPSIIFLDEIDAIAPKREKTEGEVEKRVVAQLLALMDGLESRGQVVVIGATNIPNALDPALRRPGRFDREISVGVPDEKGRREILKIHSRRMPLKEDVSLESWASRTHGFVGADLKAFCQEAAIHALRRVLPEVDTGRELSTEFLESMFVEIDDFEHAFKEVEPSAIREVRVELPDVGWAQVGGCARVKQTLQEAIEWPMRFPERFEEMGVEPPRGILITGPSGTGKTLIAQAVGRESGLNFISVKGPELLSKYVGESEERVREIFRKARLAAPCVLFFDEIDSFAGYRGLDTGGGRVVGRMVSQFLTEMDGIEKLRGVIILGATTQPEILDPSLMRPGRFELQVELTFPDEAEREEIFRIHLERFLPVLEVDVAWLARKSAGWSGARIQAACRRATMNRMREYLDAGAGPECSAEKKELARRHFEDIFD
jgi:transitional endoplasmic reticulum ATPase